MILQKCNPKNIKKGIKDPKKFIKELDRIKNRAVKQKLISILYGGENFIKKDWDNLIILDACRPDFFEEYNPFTGGYSRKTSLGSSSNEFFIRNMKNREFYDCVYVTGNTSVNKVDESVYKVVKTFSNSDAYKKGWLPETTLDAAISAYNKHPQKRLVAHFMQPHTPYIGKYAEELRNNVINEYDVGFREIKKVWESKTNSDELLANLVSAFEYGYITRTELNTVYAENLELVFKYVEKLLQTIDGKTVITADHSESLGDFNGISTHKDWAFSSKLREVPWLVIDGERRNTVAEQPVEPVSADKKAVHENLRDLGYL